MARGRFFGIVSVIPDNPEHPFIFLRAYPYSEWIYEIMKKY